MAQGSGAIVNCSSIGGLKGSRGRSAYSASKHAVIGVTRSAALDYAAKGIRITAVCPGMVNPPMAVFVTKNYDPEIVARMVAQEPIGALRRAGRNRRCRGMALQSSRELHGGSCHGGRRRHSRGLIGGAEFKKTPPSLKC